MGRLIDADKLRKEVYSWGMNDYEPSDFIDEIDNAPTIEAIPKADYEARLKADMVAMLTEIQLEIDELPNHELQSSDWKQGFTHGLADVQEKVIQKKINELKEKDNGK